MQETWVQFLFQEDPLEKEMATHLSILDWRIPWTEEPGGLHSMDCKESGMTEQLNHHYHWYTCSKANNFQWYSTRFSKFIPWIRSTNITLSLLEMHSWVASQILEQCGGRGSTSPTPSKGTCTLALNFTDKLLLIRSLTCNMNGWLAH